MSTSVIVRVAEPRDDLRLGDLLVDTFVQTYAARMPEVVVYDSRKEELRRTADRRGVAHVIVLEIEGEIAGTAALYPPGEKTSRAWIANVCDFRFMALDPRFQGRSLSKLILDEAARVARSWHADAICLHVRRGATGVAGVYVRNGYRRCPEGDVDKLPEVYLEAYLLHLRDGR